MADENRPCPTVAVHVDKVFVRPGETVTVFLVRVRPDGSSDEPTFVQVELRVTPEGVAEVFVHPEARGIVRDFTEWEAI